MSLAIWVDDDLRAVSLLSPLLTVRGYKTQGVHPEKLDDSHIRRADLLLLDLETQQVRSDGVSIAKRACLVDSSTKVLFVSRFLARHEYQNFERHLNPILPVRKISKKTLVRAVSDGYNEYTREKFQANDDLDRLLSELNMEAQNNKFPDTPTDFRTEFPIESVDSFYALPRQERIPLLLAAKASFEPLLAAIFEQEEVEWVALSLPAGEVLQWGGVNDDPPKDIQFIRRLAGTALERPAVPVTFHRPRFKN